MSVPDWERIGEDLAVNGCAVIPDLLSAAIRAGR